MSEERISYLSSGHAHITYSVSYFLNDRSMPRLRYELKSQCLECITYEYRHGLSVFLPYCQLSATELIIIHAWEIIVHERETMNTFYPQCGIHDLGRSRKPRYLLIGDESENWAESFTSSFHSITNSFFVESFDFIFCTIS